MNINGVDTVLAVIATKNKIKIKYHHQIWNDRFFLVNYLFNMQALKDKRVNSHYLIHQLGNIVWLMGVII